MKLRTRTALIVLPLALATAALAPATDAACYVVDAGDPADAADDVAVCHADGYFTAHDNGIGNLHNVGHGAPPSWDDSVPTDSYQAGAGGGTAFSATASSAGADQLRAVFEGEFTGDIDSIGVEQYVISPVDHYFWEVIDVAVSIQVDGVEVAGTDDIELRVVETADGVGMMQFVATGLYAGQPALQGSDEPHVVRIEMAGALRPWDEGVFVYDAAEVPSRVVFNGGDLVGRWSKLPA